MTLQIHLTLVLLALTSVTGSVLKYGSPEERGTDFEGDIVRGPNSMPVDSGMVHPSFRWPGNTIPYSLAADFPVDYKTTLLKAMNHITGRTCIRFKERSSEEDYIYINQNRGCSSYVGRQGGSQMLSLANGCYVFGTHVHELVHAIGFHHEHSRTDRDDYVTINYANVAPGMNYNFDKYPSGYISPFGMGYDYGSIMHYTATAFSINGNPTIIPTNPNAVIGNRKQLSKSDYTKINNMYCHGTYGISIHNIADGRVLEVQRSTIQGRPVITWNFHGGENQKWTTHWWDFMDPRKGSTLVSWSQDGVPGSVRVLDESLRTSKVMMWGSHGRSNQLWYGVWLTAYTGGTQKYQIVNKQTGRCLKSMGAQQVVTVPCDEADDSQLWRIREDSV